MIFIRPDPLILYQVIIDILLKTLFRLSKKYEYDEYESNSSCSYEKAVYITPDISTLYIFQPS